MAPTKLNYSLSHPVMMGKMNSSCNTIILDMDDTPIPAWLLRCSRRCIVCPSPFKSGFFFLKKKNPPSERSDLGEKAERNRNAIPGNV